MTWFALSALQRHDMSEASSGFVVLLLILVGAQLVWARHGRRVVAAQERALVHSTAAAALQRRQIAQRLRSETIQSMAGVGYALESLETDLPAPRRPLAACAASAVREDVRRLCALVEGLEDDVAAWSTLPAALDRAAEALRGGGTRVDLDLTRAPAVRVGTADLVHHLVLELASAASPSPPADLRISVGHHAGRLCLTVDVPGVYRLDSLRSVQAAALRGGGSFSSSRGDSSARVQVELPVR